MARNDLTIDFRAAVDLRSGDVKVTTKNAPPVGGIHLSQQTVDAIVAGVVEQLDPLVAPTAAAQHGGHAR